MGLSRICLACSRERSEGADWGICELVPVVLLIAILLPPSFFLDSLAAVVVGE